jgi:PilZ domain-containing protein
MKRLLDRRWDSRIRTHFEIMYSSGREDGSGILADISYSGALLIRASVQPRLGAEVRVYVLLVDDSPFEIVGKVVRHVEDGFAIAYANLGSELRGLVDDAAAVVANPLHVPPRRQSQP